MNQDQPENSALMPVSSPLETAATTPKHHEPELSPRQRKALRAHLKTVSAIRRRFLHLPAEIQRHVALKLGLECGLLIQGAKEEPCKS